MSTRKRITELTVAELRIQLGKRGVDTAGDRPALISKLKKALQEENAKTSATPKTGAGVTGGAAQPAQGDGGSGTPTLLGPQKLKMEKTSDGEEETKTTDSGGNNVTSVPASMDKIQSTPVAATSASTGIVLRSSTRVVTEVPGTTCAARAVPAAVVEPVTSTPATEDVGSSLTPVTVMASSPTPVTTITHAESLIEAPVVAVSTTEEPSSTTSTPVTAATTAAAVAKPPENVAATKPVTPESPVTSSASDANVSQSQTDVVASVAPSASVAAPVASSAVPSEDITAKTSGSAVSSAGEVPKATTVVAPKNVTTPKAVVLPTVAPTVGVPTIVTKKPVVTATPSSAVTPKSTAVGARKVAAPPGAAVPAASGSVTGTAVPAASGSVTSVATPVSTTTPSTSTPSSPSVAPSISTTAVNKSPVAAAASPVVADAVKPEAADKVTTSAPDTESTDKDGATPAGEVTLTVVKEEKMDQSAIVDLTADSPMDTTPSSSTAAPKTSTKPAVTNKTIAQSVMTDGSTTGHSLWVSGLTTSFRAADLKVLFGNHGKVIAAKVVTSAKSPGSKCFGYVLMSSVEEAEEAINKLNNTEVQGQKITVEKDRQKRAIVQPSTASVSAQIPASTTLWVNGLSSTTKAADLKMLFMKHGKVTGAKVVTSAKNPGSKCYGLVTLSTAEEADVCIRSLNKTEFHGKIISLEKAKSDVKTQSKTTTPSTGASPSASGSAVNKKDGKMESTGKKDDTKQKQNESELTKDAEKDQAKEVKKDDNILSLDKIKEERERERRMQRERATREAERRRLRDLEHERRMQRAESERLTREREKLRLEKLRLERERMEAERARMQLERERQRRDLERERELERMERQRRESRQTSPGYRSELKRSSGSNDGNYWQQAKRPLLDDRPVASFTGTYSAHGSSGFYDKTASSQFIVSDRRDATRAREPEKTGSSMQSSWANYRPHDGRTNEPTQRTTAIEQTAFSSNSDWNRGAGASQWQQTANTYRAADSNYPGLTGSSTADSSRQYMGSAPASNTYMGGATGQSYKWY